MVLGLPSMCISTTGVPNSAATAPKSGSKRNAEISLIIDAPALIARLATSAFMVSMDMGMEISAASCSMTGMTRSVSTSTGTGSENGRVDSPPISSMSAPSAASLRPWVTADSGSRNFPPSENESGVTLTTPIIPVRGPSSMS